MRMKNIPALILFLLLAALVRGQAAVPVSRPQRPIPAVEHVLIISIDGLRPDLALLADMPNLRGLLKQGDDGGVSFANRYSSHFFVQQEIINEHSHAKPHYDDPALSHSGLVSLRLQFHRR